MRGGGHHKLRIFCDLESVIYSTYYLKCKKRITVQQRKNIACDYYLSIITM